MAPFYRVRPRPDSGLTLTRWPLPDGLASGVMRYLDVKIHAATTDRSLGDGLGEEQVSDHLHPDRRGARAGDVLLPAGDRRLRVDRRGGRRDPRHLAVGPDHRPVPRPAHRRAAPRRRARGARRAREDARGQHHQAAEHQRLDPAAQGRDRRAAGAGLRPAGLPRQPVERRGEGRPRALRQGQGQRGQPGAARGQLRPSRARVGEELRQGAPALDGRVEPRLADQRRAHDRRRLPLQRAVRRAGRRTTTCASSWSATTARPPCCASRCRSSRARSSTRP